MEVVAKLRGALASRLGKERYELWFGSDAWMSVVEGTVRIEASQPFIIERLRKGFRTEIEAATADVFGGIVPVEFCVAPSSAQTDAVQSKVVESSNIESSSREPEKSRVAQANNPAAETASKAQSVLPTELTSGQTLPQKEANCQSADRQITDRQVTDRQVTVKRPAKKGGRRKFMRLSKYVVGSSNQLALRSAQMITSELGEISPLFVYGPTGTGKTHLLEGIWSEIRRKESSKKVVYLSAEQFTTYFLEALKSSGLPSFRRKYRQLDMLIVDDLQFFAGKRATVNELLHTTDNLIRQGNQVVFAADRPPQELPHLGQELTARLTGGLVCQVQPLDIDTRKELIRRLARDRSVPMSPTVIDTLARSAPGDARRLSGAVNRLMLVSNAQSTSVDADMVQTVINELFPGSRKDLHLVDIERAVCETFELTSRTLQSDKKTRGISHPRMLAMWLARKYTRAALSEISEYFGRRSHSTVLSAQRKVNNWIDEDSTLEVTSRNCSVRDVVRKLEDKLRVG